MVKQANIAMRKSQKFKIKTIILMMLVGLSCLAWADEQSETKTANETEAVIWYACPLINNHVSYTTSPLDVHCQVAKHPPTDDSDIKVRLLENINVPRFEELQRLWYSAEFGQDSDLMKVSPAPKLGIHLRQLEANKINSRNLTRNVVIPAKIIVPPKLTPKQLVQRDINNEQRALAMAQKQLAEAKKRGSSVQIQRWQQNVTDRQANIRVLKQELSRY